MASYALIPDYEELSSFISSTFSTLRATYMEWANLSRRAIQGLQYNASRLSALEDFIIARREELRKAVMLASEHFVELKRAQADEVRMRPTPLEFALYYDA